MIIGKCPYCDASNINSCPEDTPKFSKIICEECKEQYWLKFSRYDPEAWTRDNFDKLYVVDEEKKSIKPTKEHEQQIRVNDIILSTPEGQEALAKIHHSIMDDILSGGLFSINSSEFAELLKRKREE